VVVDEDSGVGVRGKILEAETIFDWIKLEEINNREITANTITLRKVFLNLLVCSPFNSFTGN
jgi:hypothetical protein